jgi:hypothetical protein
MSLAKALRREGAGRGPSSRANVRDLRKISPFGRNDINSELSVFAPLREEYPNPRVFDTWKICAKNAKAESLQLALSRLT